MGPWWVRDPERPHTPGCRYSVLLKLIESGRIKPNTVLRGPSTRQFWMLAKNTPGVANRLGFCHSCARETQPDAFACDGCGVAFTVDGDRQHLGIGPERDLVPGMSSTTSTADQIEPVTRLAEPEPLPAAAVATPPQKTLPTPFPCPIRRISPLRLAMNWLVGVGVFTMVTLLVLSWLPAASLHTTPQSADDVIAANTSELPWQSDPEQPSQNSVERQLTPFGTLDLENDDSTSTDTRLARTNQESSAVQDATAQPVAVSREAELRNQALEALRLGNPQAIRAALLGLDALATLPSPPDWIEPTRTQLVVRLERSRFARLP